jgi:hypothetical protein
MGISSGVNRGAVIPVVIFLSCYFVESSTNSIFHNEQFYLQQRWPIPLSLLIAAGILKVFVQARRKTIREEEREWCISHSNDHDPHQHTETPALAFLRVLRPGDYFLMIPARFWPWVLIGLTGITYLFPPGRL